ncbi:MAG: hypothetical protein JXQ75_08665, partial [Phycisphaerae bacterium]|nr:hypothetical protein [Phycisphaerae bacterium]
MNKTVVNYLKAVVTLLVLPVILGVDCPGEENTKLAEECAHPKASTICTAVCKTKKACFSCCKAHPANWPNGK